jgi:hypothetical protein
MAKEKEKPKEEEKGGEKGGKGKKRLHLHEIRTTQAHDGSFTHHHTYKDSKSSPYTHPERGPMATSETPEDAGQHVAEQFGMNQMGGGAAGGAEPEEPEAGQGAPPPEAGPMGA